MARANPDPTPILRLADLTDDQELKDALSTHDLPTLPEIAGDEPRALPIIGFPEPQADTLSAAASAVRTHLFQLADDLDTLGSRLTEYRLEPARSRVEPDDESAESIENDIQSSVVIVERLRSMVDQMTKILG